MEKHLIVIELDNVILKDHRELTDFSKKILKMISDMNHKIVFTTSRPYGNAMKEYHESLDFPSVVVASGGRDAHNNNGTTILNYSSNYSCFEEALKVGVPLLKSAIWSIGDELYVYKEDDILTPVIENFIGKVIKLDEISADFKLPEAPSTAFCIPHHGKVHEFFMAMNDIDGIVGAVYDNDNLVIEVQQDDVSKKSTIEMILSASGIDEENVIVFAVSEKDLELAKDAAHPYVMKNAPEYVKEIFTRAKVTCDTCSDDGVAKELIKYFNLSV